MDATYTEAELTSFLDYLAEKGILNANTAQGRKVATLKILSALDDHEKLDLRSVDRETTFQRFVNRFGREFNPKSLQVYRSRFNSTLQDFFRYQQNPAAFRTSVPMRTARVREGTESSFKDPRRSASRHNAAQPDQTARGTPLPQTIVFPVPIRDGVVVQIHNLPNDLTPAEAARISAVVSALARAEDD